jgi:large subunit ribosomal protein L16
MKFFKKKHLIVNYQISNKSIKNIIQGQFAIFFKQGGIMNINEYKALIFFLKKNIKFFSKLFIRVIPNIKNTKKSIGVRMGKGKGPLNEYYMNVSKGQIFIEFGFDKKLFILNNLERQKLLRRLKKIIFLSSLKTKIKFSLINNKLK